MLEKDIEKKVCDYAKDLGGIGYKFTSPNRKNVPDRLFVMLLSLSFFIEFKATGEFVTPGGGQDREAQRLRNRGQRVYECNDVAQGIEIIYQEVVNWCLR